MSVKEKAEQQQGRQYARFIQITIQKMEKQNQGYGNETAYP
jgi:hypothetical protein